MYTEELYYPPWKALYTQAESKGHSNNGIKNKFINTDCKGDATDIVMK